MYGFSGKITGKKGDAVFRVRNGEQIVSQYNPLVNNPQTRKQVEARAALKLMSQLSAIIAPVVAMRKQGAVTSRNLFVKANYPNVVVSGEKAEFPMYAMQLTSSHVGLVPFNASRADGLHLNVQLDEDATNNVDRVVYVAVVKMPDTSLRLLDSIVVDEAGDNGTFPGALAYTANEVTVLAYGMRDNNDRVKAALGNIHGADAEGIAELITSRQIMEGDITLTETIGLTLRAGETSGDSGDNEYATVTLLVEGSGTVTGAGSYLVGSQVVVTANAASGNEFLGWYDTNDNRVTASYTYQFTLASNTTLKAKFQAVGNISIQVASNNNSLGTVSGGGSYSAGQSVTVHATPTAGNRFVSWTEGGNVVSTNADYNFTASQNRDLTANFEAAGSTVTVAVTKKPEIAAVTVEGGGQFAVGSQVTVETRCSDSNYIFVGWYNDATRVSTNTAYSFTAANNVTLTATWQQGEE